MVGALVALQSRINAELARDVGGGFVAALISFATGLALALMIVAFAAPVRRGFGRLRAALRGHRLSPWQLLGGLGGAWLVTTQGLVVTVVGVTIFIVAVVGGQVAGSLAVDRVGLSPAGVLPVSARRLVAAVIALLAVGVSGVAHAGEGPGSAAGVAVLLAVSAGLGVSVQQAINGRVSFAARDPMVAATVNFIVGTTALTLVVTLLSAFGVISFGTLPGEWWLYLGGPIGLAFIALAAWAVRHLGVLTFGLLSIAGQLAGSVLLDRLAPATQSVLNGWQLIGLILVVVAVWLAATPRRGLAPPPPATMDQ